MYLVEEYLSLASHEIIAKAYDGELLEKVNDHIHEQHCLKHFPAKGLIQTNIASESLLTR